MITRFNIPFKEMTQRLSKKKPRKKNKKQKKPTSELPLLSSNIDERGFLNKTYKWSAILVAAFQ